MDEELSIKEKAERYDEVLKIVKDAHTHHYDDKEQLRKIESIFYEINEDEDERIRKEIIDYIKDQQSSFISAPDCRDKYEKEENNKYNSWIAWLKKEDKPAKCSEENKKYMSAIIKMVEHCSFSSIGGITKAAAIYWLKFTKDRVQPNQGWSEEDEAILNWCVSDIERAKYCKSQTKPKLCDDEINWLKSLKDRIQPEQEWDEEDSYMLRQAIICVNNSGKLEVSTEEIESWLKSRRPQRQWKPSKKQLIALNDLNIAGYLKNVGQGDILIELYNDLKRLVE